MGAKTMKNRLFLTALVLTSTIAAPIGPASAERVAFRRSNWDATAWVRETVLGVPQAAA